jgi:hypothetical protein
MSGAALFSILTGNAPVSAILGNRVFPVIVPPQAWDGAALRPCVVYRTFGLDPQYKFCGRDDLEAENFFIDVYSQAYDTTQALSAAVKAALEAAAKTTHAGVFVDRIFTRSEIDGVDLEPGLHRRSISITVYHRSA